MFKPNSIIAEIGSTHDGKINLAIRSIKSASDAGAKIIKFQMHISEEETLKSAPNPPYFKGENRYKYFKRTSFNFNQWKKIINECKANKVEFLCSPFSLKAVEILEKLKVKAYKIASGELTNLPLLEKIYKTGKFVFISTGMSNFREIENALKIFKNKRNICLMQCTSMYPCPDEMVGLNIISQFKKKYKVLLGYSDHTKDYLSSVCSATLGVKFVEKHFTLSKNTFGSDAKFAMEPKDFRKYCDNLNRVWNMIDNKVNKNNLKKLKKMKQVFEKSIVAKRDLKKNHQIKLNDLTFLKPGDGLRADIYKKIIGTKTKKDIQKLKKIKFSDLKKNDNKNYLRIKK